MGGSTGPPVTGSSLSGMLWPPQTWAALLVAGAAIWGWEAPACSSAGDHQGSDVALRRSPGLQVGAVRTTRGCPMPEATPGGPGPPPAPRPRALVAALSHCRHCGCLCGDVTKPCTSSWPGRGSRLSSHSRCLLTPAAQRAKHCCAPPLGPWVPAAWLVLGKYTCCVLLQVHFLQSSHQPYKVRHGKMKK